MERVEMTVVVCIFSYVLIFAEVYKIEMHPHTKFYVNAYAWTTTHKFIFVILKKYIKSKDFGNMELKMEER